MRTPVPEAAHTWRQARLKSGPLSWALVAVVLLFASLPLGNLRVWHGILLAIPFLLATAGLGWRASAALAPAALLLVWLRTLLDGSHQSAADYLLIAGALALASVGGDGLYRVWRSAEQRARDAGRRATLLQEATVDLNHATDMDALFRSAPRLLSDILPFAHAAVFVPDGRGLKVHTTWRWGADPDFDVPLSSVMGRAFKTQEPQYVADCHLDRDFIQAPGAEFTRSELAIPVMTGKRVRAIVNLEHRDTNAFGPADRATLVAFVRMMEEVLARLDALAALSETTAHQEFMARLNRRLLLADGVTEAAEAALDEILAMFDLDIGAVLELHYARLRPIAVHGSPPPALAALVRDGFPFTGLLRHAWEARELVLVDDLASDADWTTSTEARAVAAVPIVDLNGQVQALLVVTRFREPLPTWSERTRELLGELSVPLGAAFARAALNRQLFATLEAIKQLKSTSSPETLYRHAAIAAADLVPNAEAVSILVRHGESFHYEAAVGYDLDRLQAEAGPFSYGEQLTWYRGDVASFEGGVGRIMHGSDSLTMSASSGQMLVAPAEARLNDLRCQLAVPIVDRDGVVAFLNVDNFSTDDAFGPAALRIAEAFAQHLTIVVRQAEQVLELERSAITDPLTGLGNREGFNRAFKLELARARRYEHHLSLMLLDLNDFKEINDRFGHAEGDKALVAVADALAGAARGSDQVFRWGGDEFAIVMPEVRPADAQAAAERLGRVVASLAANGVGLTISIGVANYPVDGLDRETLLEVSDHRMYVSKRADDVRAARHSRRSGPSTGPSSAAALAGTPPAGGRGTPVNAGRDSK